jgi:hypothetical protein
MMAEVQVGKEKGISNKAVYMYRYKKATRQQQRFKSSAPGMTNPSKHFAQYST